MSVELTLKKRGAKTSQQQYQIFVEEMKGNEILRNNKFHPSYPNRISEVWTSLTEKINSSGGPIRSVEAWKKVFADWKCHVKKKARDIKLEMQRIGGGPPTKQLSQLEEQLIEVIGNCSVYGITDIQKAGLIINLNESVVNCNEHQENLLESTSTNDINQNIPEVLVEMSTLPMSSVKKRKANTLTSVVEAFQKNGNSYASELAGIRNKLRKIRKIKKFKALVEYHKNKIRYPNFPSVEMSDIE